VIDSHTHIDRCDGTPAELVAAAQAAGVARILTIGMDEQSCRASVAISEQFPSVFFAVGRHPNVATGFDDAALDSLLEFAAHPRCLAIGETGLDFYREGAPAEDQQRAFEAQIELARSLRKPLVIHTRAAEEPTLATLRERAQGLAVIMHCFSMPERLDECLEQGWWISFAGNVTYPSNGELAAAARAVPADRLLVETDAPYLSPQAVRRQRNQPAYVAHTLQFIAQLRETDAESLAATVRANGERLFGW
jgi:TatD DNase family protein